MMKHVSFALAQQFGQANDLRLVPSMSLGNPSNIFLT
jgi:hypothetical protein